MKVCLLIDNCRVDEAIPFFACIMFIVTAINCSPNLTLNVLKSKTSFRKYEVNSEVLIRLKNVISMGYFKILYWSSLKCDSMLLFRAENPRIWHKIWHTSRRGE